MALLEAAISRICRHHDILRARFLRQGSGWRQTIGPPEDRIPLIHVDLSRLDPPRRQRATEPLAARLQASLDLTLGPLLRVAYFAPGTIFFAIHHLVVDRVSWPVVLEDLERAYTQLAARRPVALPPRTTSYKRWAELLVRRAESVEAKSEMELWSSYRRERFELPVDRAGSNLRGSNETSTVTLDSEETRRLMSDVPAAYDTRALEPMLLALVRSFAAWTGRASLLVELEAHGREDLFEDVDLSRTVGWFTSTFPVLLDLENVTDYGDALIAVRDRIRSLPHHGIGFGVLRYLCEDAGVKAALRRVPRPQVRFNYTGRIEPASLSLFDFAGDTSGPETSPRGERSHLLELNAYVFQNRLSVDWSYSREVHRPSTVDRLAGSFLEQLRKIIGFCLNRL